MLWAQAEIQWKLLRCLEEIPSALQVTQTPSTQEVPSPVIAGSRQSTRKEVSHRLVLLLLVPKPLIQLLLKGGSWAGWSLIWSQDDLSCLSRSHTLPKMRSSGMYRMPSSQTIHIKAHSPDSPHPPVLKHLLSRWDLLPPPCARRGREDKRTQKLWKTPPLTEDLFSFYSIATLKKTWSIISKLNFLGRAVYIFLHFDNVCRYQHKLFCRVSMHLKLCFFLPLLNKVFLGEMSPSFNRDHNSQERPIQ